MLQRDKRQKRAAQHFQCTRNDPAGPGDNHRSPPAPAVVTGLLRHETQKIDLFANLHDQCKRDGRGTAEHQPVEAISIISVASQGAELGVELGRFPRNRRERQQHQHQPQWLRPQLHPADERDTVRHQRDHRERTDQVGERERDVEIEFERQRHDDGFECEEYERETGVNERGKSRAEVAKARPAREQIHVEPIARGVDADR